MSRNGMNDTRQSLKLNAILNAVKQLCTIIFPLISIPYITRILEPNNYGIFSFGSTIVGYFSLLAALGISSYAIREGSACRDNRVEVSKLASELFSINVLSTILSYVLLFITILHPAMEPYKKVIVVQSLVILLNTIGTDWVNAMFEDFLFITVRYIGFQLGAIVSMFLFVHKPDDYLIYTWIVVGAQAGANVLNAFHVRRYVNIRFTTNIDWKRHCRPILIFFANILAITIYVNADITMLGLMRTDEEVGVYTLVSKIYSVVKQLLNAVVVVALPRLSMLAQLENQTRFKSLTDRIKRTLLVVLLPVVCGIYIFSDSIVYIAGGEKYFSGGIALQVLSIAIVFSLLATFYSSCILIPLKKERFVLYATILSSITNIMLNIVLIPLYGIIGAATTTLASEAIVFAIWLHLCYKEDQIVVSLNYIIRVMLGCIPVIIICWVMNRYCQNALVSTLLAMLITIPLYLVLEYMIGNDVLTSEVTRMRSKLSHHE